MRDRVALQELVDRMDARHQDVVATFMSLAKKIGQLRVVQAASLRAIADADPTTGEKILEAIKAIHLDAPNSEVLQEMEDALHQTLQDRFGSPGDKPH